MPPLRIMEINTDWLAEVKFNSDELIPTIAQDNTTGRILMMAWMSKKTLEQTIKTGKAIYWSRSRRKPWRKGEKSGHEQVVKTIQLDCDGDAIILKVEQIGGIACHTGRNSCFFRTLTVNGWQTSESVIKDPTEIYTND